MQTLKVRIFPDGSAEIDFDGKIIKSSTEVEEIVKKIHNKEIGSQVYYYGKKVTLCSVQGGIGVKGIGYIAPLLFNPLANLFLALCQEW